MRGPLLAPALGLLITALACGGNAATTPADSAARAQVALTPSPTAQSELSTPSALLDECNPNPARDLRRYSIDVATGELTFLAYAPPYPGTLSPDGTMIAEADDEGLHVSKVETSGEPAFADSVTPDPSLTTSDGAGARYPYPTVGSLIWSPDSLLVAYIPHPPVVHGPLGLAVAGVDGTDQWSIELITELTSVLTDTEPDAWTIIRWSWAPDSSRLALHFRNANYPRVAADDSLFVIGADGTGLRQVFSGLQMSPTISFTWSPDGKKLAVKTSTKPYKVDKTIWVVDAETAEQSVVAEVATFREWAPDSTRLLYSARPTDASRSDMMVVKADGTGTMHLTKSPEGELEAAWAPDGKSIAFWRTTSGEGGNPPPAFFVLDIDSGAERRLETFELHRGGFFFANPIWSPVGQRIAVFAQSQTADGAASPGIFVMEADGSGITRVKTLCSFGFGELQWAEDGRAVVLSRTSPQYPVCDTNC